MIELGKAKPVGCISLAHTFIEEGIDDLLFLSRIDTVVLARHGEGERVVMKKKNVICAFIDPESLASYHRQSFLRT
jgi:hypothetical protein